MDQIARTSTYALAFPDEKQTLCGMRDREVAWASPLATNVDKAEKLINENTVGRAVDSVMCLIHCILTRLDWTG